MKAQALVDTQSNRVVLLLTVEQAVLVNDVLGSFRDDDDISWEAYDGLYDALEAAGVDLDQFVVQVDNPVITRREMDELGAVETEESE